MIRATAALSLLGLAACAPTPSKLAPAQIEAIQTRRIDAPPDAALRAAAGIMLDRGMVITMSDFSGGLVAGSAWSAPGPHTHGPDQRLAEVVVWVRPDGRGSLMRVQPIRSSVPLADADLVSRIAGQVSQRALMAAPGHRDRGEAPGAAR